MARARSSVSQCARPVGPVNADGTLKISAPSETSCAEQLGEAQIVAHGQSEPARGRVDRDGLRAGHRVRRFAVALAPARQVDVEQVDLVVARRALAGGVVDDAGIRRTRLARDRDRLRAGDDPERRARAPSRRSPSARARRRPRSTTARRSASLRPMKEKFSGSTARQAPPSRACCSSRRAVARFFATSASRGHLDGGDDRLAHARRVPDRRRALARVAFAAASFISWASMRFTCGSSQLPVMR